MPSPSYLRSTNELNQYFKLTIANLGNKLGLIIWRELFVLSLPFSGAGGMKISYKLILSYLTIVVLMQLVGRLCIKAIDTTQAQFVGVVDRIVLTQNTLHELKYHVKQVTTFAIEVALLESVLSPEAGTEPQAAIAADQEKIKQKRNAVAQAKQEYSQALDTYQSLIHQFSPAEQATLTQLKTQSEQVVSMAERIVQRRRIGNAQAAIVQQTTALEMVNQQFLRTIEAAIAAESQELATLNQDTLFNAKIGIYVTSVLAFLIATGTCAAIVHSICHPLNQLTAASIRIGRGKLRTKVNVHRQDEFGELARAFNQMATTLWRTTAYAVKVRDSMVESLIVLTPNTLTIHSVNKATCHLLGYQRREMVGQPIEALLPGAATVLKHPDWQEHLNEQGFIHHVEIRYETKTGSFIPVLFSASLMRTSDRQNLGIVCVAQDITDRYQAELKLKRSLSLIQATLESTGDGILVVNCRGEIEDYNQKFLEMWSIPAELAQAQQDLPLFNFVLPQLKDPDAFLAQVEALYADPEATSGDVLEFIDGRIFECYSQPQRLNGEIVGRVWSFRDVTQRYRNEATIRYQALHDLLTGLPNRILFHDRLSIALAQAARDRMHLAVMFLDLDRFKVINDTLGHAVGDLLLRGVAQRLQGCLRESDTISRWGGDEFTILLPSLHQIEEATTIAQRILAVMKPDFALEEHTLHISTSVGIAIYPSDGQDAETLLKNADAALYRAKESGRNHYCIYTSAINCEATAQLTMENDLHRALERQEFALYYQPQVNVSTGEIMKMEALLRWQHPTQGLVPPNKFIPLAEESGLIVPIGEWALRTACTQVRIWQDAGLTGMRVAVNLSAQQFRYPQLVNTVQQVLQETQLAPTDLELEITETTVMKNVDLAHLILNELDAIGISIAMDDFGTGYSSLSYLKRFPVRTLKIDQSFVRDLTTDPNDSAIVAAIIAMGKVLKLNLIAEGVETEVQEYLLRSLGCQEMQGYLFSPPLSAEAATQFLQTVASQVDRLSMLT